MQKHRSLRAVFKPQTGKSIFKKSGAGYSRKPKQCGRWGTETPFKLEKRYNSYN